MIAIELALTVNFYCTHMQLYVILIEIQAGCMRGVRAMLHVFAGCHRSGQALVSVDGWMF